MAAPPAAKFSSIWRFTSDGKAETPCAVTPWLAGEDADQRPVDAGIGLALPGGEPFGDPFQAAEAAGRLGELPVAHPHGLDGRLVRAGHGRDQAADIVER